MIGIAELDRFWSKVDASGDCWEWQASKYWNGYGQAKLNGRGMNAHRVAWLILRGEIANGLQLDHLCRNRSCVNPDHMEPVSRRENILRGISPVAVNFHRFQCKNGHPFDLDNTKMLSGNRRCVKCNRMRSLEWWRRNVK